MPLRTKVGLGPGHNVLHGDPAAPKGAQPANFRPMSIVTERSPITATADHLFTLLPVLSSFPGLLLSVLYYSKCRILYGNFPFFLLLLRRFLLFFLSYFNSTRLNFVVTPLQLKQLNC